jgi:hypothetical protein
MLFVQNKEGLLTPCIDHSKLNQGTIRDQYPLPVIAQTLALLSKVKYISEINIRNAFSIVSVHDEDI